MPEGVVERLLVLNPNNLDEVRNLGLCTHHSVSRGAL